MAPEEDAMYPLTERQARLGLEIAALLERGYALAERRQDFAYARLTHPERRPVSIEVREDGAVGIWPAHERR